MNPLKEKQVKQLEALNCADLARKVDELVRYINEQCFFGKEMTVNVCNGKEDMPQCFCRSYYDDEGKLQDCTCGKCGKPEPCQLHKENIKDLLKSEREKTIKEIKEWLIKKYSKENEKFGGIVIYEDLIDYLNNII